MSETREQNFSKSEENNLEVYGIVATSSRQGRIFRYFKHGSGAAGGGGGVVTKCLSARQKKTNF
jgi:hypothetical protein